MITIHDRDRGFFKNTERYLNKLRKEDLSSILNKYGTMGVNALSSATPVNTGKTAASWGYEIEKRGSSIAIVFTNSNINAGTNIAVILQYGHGTSTGGYVVGRDYINPATRPLFDNIAEDAWKEVRSL